MGDNNVKKKIKPGAIELHPEDQAIVVLYEVRMRASKACAANAARAACASSPKGGACSSQPRSHACTRPCRRHACTRRCRLPPRVRMHALAQVQEVSVGPDGKQEIIGRESSSKK